MAESAVTFLLTQLKPLLVEGSKLLAGVREEAEYIRDELERIRAFLREADAMEESDSEIRVWVKQVRDVAHDTEDVLDEFMLRFGHRHGNGLCGRLCRMGRSVKSLRARYRIACEIRRLKSRVSDISQGHQRYHYKYSVSFSNPNVGNRACHDSRRSDALLLEEAELVGIDKPKAQLSAWLVEDDRRFKVLSVVGMGGLGKTTLAKKVFDDTDLRTRFQSHAWITVSELFEMKELLKDLIRQLFDEIRQPIPERMENMDDVKLKEVVKEFLQERRYVIVLDDVWSIDAWDAFKHALPSCNRGSRVLLTTRISDVASTSCIESHGRMYTMEALLPQESYALFCRKTFQGIHCPPHLKKIVERILEKCKGLPLAIVVISGVLATKDQTRAHEWEMVCRSLADGAEGNNRLESMKRILSLSYNDLPCHLKICFLYLGIFPEDYLIEPMRLIRLWIAEGFVEEREGKTTEEVAERFLKELVSRSLVQVVGTKVDGSTKNCHIHDLFREIVLSKSKEQNIMAIAGEGGATSSWPEKVRRLSIHHTFGDIKVEQSKCFSRLRSLLMFEVAEQLPETSVPMSLISSGGVRLLKVLDMRRASLETIPNEVFKLFHLRYLSLRETKVEMLPKSVGKLRNLETLDLKHTCVTELPVQILKLQRLRHLLVYSYHTRGYLAFHNLNGFKALQGIGNLQSLQKLCYIEMDCENAGLIAQELEKLTQLRRLGISKLRRQDGMVLCSSIEKLRNLQSLNIGSVDEGEVLDVQSLSTPPQSLRHLYLEGRLEKMPHWIPSLHNLVKVRLRWSKLNDEPLQALQGLPNLVYLQLMEAFQGEGLCFRAEGFYKLKILNLLRLERLAWVTMERGTMPCLERLCIEDCNWLEDLPSGIEHQSNLKILELNDMSDRLIGTIYQQEGCGLRISHIPQVWIGSYREGAWRGHALQRQKPKEEQEVEGLNARLLRLFGIIITIAVFIFYFVSFIFLVRVTIIG